jgi:hypothetical protein
MIIYPNYTFSVPDKRLYTLYKGITVTPRLLQASSVSSYGQATFTRGTPSLCFVRRPFTRPTQPRVTVPFRQNQGYRLRHTFSAEPVRDPTPIASGFRGVSPELPFPPAPERGRRVALLTYPHLRRRKSASFGITEGGSCTCETTLT